MSLLKTKPSYAPDCVATESGWTNPVTGEVLVAIGNLKAKLKAEKAAEKKAPVVVEKKAPVVVKHNKVLVKENFKKSTEKGQFLIGEVVEFPVVDGAVVIGE